MARYWTAHRIDAEHEQAADRCREEAVFVNSQPVSDLITYSRIESEQCQDSDEPATHIVSSAGGSKRGP